MIRRILIAISALTTLAIPGCGTGPIGPSQPTASPLVLAATATPTEIIWFPPTETSAAPQAAPPEPTPERRPGVGELITSDDMRTTTHWNAEVGGEAAATVSDMGLSLSAQPGEPAVVSIHRSAVFDNMYLEVTARPNLCRDRDAYGLVFRAPNDVAHYRFVVICDGTAAAERVSLGTPRVLQPPTASADAPVGAPGEVKLGVWALGPEQRFFLNDRYQFTLSDSNYVVGGVGVFAQAGGETPVVVTFSDFSAYRLTPSEPLASPTP